jgi:hypothetical protein
MVEGSFYGGKKKAVARTNQLPHLTQKLRMGTMSLPLPQILTASIRKAVIFVCKYSIIALSRYPIRGINIHEFVKTKPYARNQRVYRLNFLRHSNSIYILCAISRCERDAQVQEKQPSATKLVMYWSHCAACFGWCTEQKKLPKKSCHVKYLISFTIFAFMIKSQLMYHRKFIMSEIWCRKTSY